MEKKIASAVLEWGIATEVLPGQTDCGDRHLVQPYPYGALVGVVDGLGHGAPASEAAEIAVSTLKNHARESVLSLLQRCHEALRRTRGVVMTLVSFAARDNTLTAIGVGNVEGLLVRADPQLSAGSETLMLRGGVVGQSLPPLRAEVIPVWPGDRLILATDGIHSGFGRGLHLSDTPQQTAERILSQSKKGTDDALVLVARYLGRS